MAKVLTVVGARPQFIKAAPVSRALQRAGAEEVMVHTGQHSDANMSDVFFTDLGITEPHYQLQVSGGSHGEMTGTMLQRLEPILVRESPDTVLLYGDTNSTLAGAITAGKLDIPIAHVEAGLRSHNRKMPEEQNRIVTDHLSEILFTPTHGASENLLREGISRDRINEVGDVMYDVALTFGQHARTDSTVLRRFDLTPREYVLATVHRAENTDVPERLSAIMNALECIADTLPVILPMHPRTAKAMNRLGLRPRNLITTEPTSYLDMVALESSAAVVATDSGGVQKEAYFHRVPCVTLRDETEWVELVELGWNRLAPPLETDIAGEVLAALGSVGGAGNPYGRGDASMRIADVLAGERGRGP